MQNNNKKNRFKLLKNLFYQAPLKPEDQAELEQLAKEFDPKMYKYLKSNHDFL